MPNAWVLVLLDKNWTSVHQLPLRNSLFHWLRGRFMILKWMLRIQFLGEAQYSHYSLMYHSLGEHALQVNGPWSLRTAISRDLGLKEGAIFVAHPCHENAQRL